MGIISLISPYISYKMHNSSSLSDWFSVKFHGLYASSTSEFAIPWNRFLPSPFDLSTSVLPREKHVNKEACYLALAESTLVGHLSIEISSLIIHFFTRK